eukprot:1260607-Rhodomonas_salina.3
MHGALHCAIITKRKHIFVLAHSVSGSASGVRRFAIDSARTVPIWAFALSGTDLGFCAIRYRCGLPFFVFPSTTRRGFVRGSVGARDVRPRSSGITEEISTVCFDHLDLIVWPLTVAPLALRNQRAWYTSGITERAGVERADYNSVFAANRRSKPRAAAGTVDRRLSRHR